MRMGAVLIALLAIQGAPMWASRSRDRAEILKVREAVWRAWFAGDVNTLRDLVPPDAIVISASEPRWKNQAEVFRSAADFHAVGGRLIQFEFPHTEIQCFGDVAIV
jgi:ketosteroid isomerase-like protein